MVFLLAIVWQLLHVVIIDYFSLTPAFEIDIFGVFQAALTIWLGLYIAKTITRQNEREGLEQKVNLDFLADIELQVGNIENLFYEKASEGIQQSLLVNMMQAVYLRSQIIIEMFGDEDLILHDYKDAIKSLNRSLTSKQLSTGGMLTFTNEDILTIRKQFSQSMNALYRLKLIVAKNI